MILAATIQRRGLQSLQAIIGVAANKVTIAKLATMTASLFGPKPGWNTNEQTQTLPIDCLCANHLRVCLFVHVLLMFVCTVYMCICVYVYGLETTPTPLDATNEGIVRLERALPACGVSVR